MALAECQLKCQLKIGMNKSEFAQFFQRRGGTCTVTFPHRKVALGPRAGTVRDFP